MTEGLGFIAEYGSSLCNTGNSDFHIVSRKRTRNFYLLCSEGNQGWQENIAEIYEYIKPLVEDEAKQLNVQQSPTISPDVEKIKGKVGLRK